MSATELVCAAPSQQQLCRGSNSVAAALQPSNNLALKWSSHRRVPPRGAAGSSSRRDAAQPRGSRRDASCARHQLRRSRAAPSQQQQQATEWSRDNKRPVTFEIEGRKKVEPPPDTVLIFQNTCYYYCYYIHIVQVLRSTHDICR